MKTSTFRLALVPESFVLRPEVDVVPVQWRLPHHVEYTPHVLVGQVEYGDPHQRPVGLQMLRMHVQYLKL